MHNLSGLATTFTGKLHLVDLAGNERYGQRYVGEDIRQDKQASAESLSINQSLVSLANVISALSRSSRSSSSSNK
eukprot:CAMPEP_0175173904 /NCGR_PEP_ID=MMETSP0087-20121206/32324_1 /TAXON_ID=136419 /ORGANISM="Unknown Unknown, Strain D1" /LENGTH=74 /DNA_ID=CAMNT_0016465291 /DNA_START=147 /DNA_END=368 /DNA_ORIENTATION=-